MSILAIDTATATLATLRPALQEADAYTGVARFNVADLRSYARKVQVLRADGEKAAITAENVDALMVVPAAVAPVAPVVEEAPVAPVVEEAPVAPVVQPSVEQLLAQLDAQVAQLVAAPPVAAPVAPRTSKAPGTVSEKFVALFAATIKGAAPEQDGTVVVTPAMIRAAGWSSAYSTLRNGWGLTKTAGLAAQGNGYTTVTRKADNESGFVVVCTPVAK